MNFKEKKSQLNKFKMIAEYRSKVTVNMKNKKTLIRESKNFRRLI